MSIVSYAQNFEDVMLWRALKHVENGFYIDVGANDPSIDSVTRSFYERGWSGINVEPLPSHHLDLQHERPRDINLQCAAGAVHGEIELWECDVRGWATADETVASLHRANGHQGVLHKVQVLPLSEICAANAKGEIHFLKIDVEGFEKSVIEGMDFTLFRPWVLVVEATRPNSTEEIHDEWEHIVLSSGYILAYTDGLNRFYVAREHSELLGMLRYPPNVFDGFIRVEQINAERLAQEAESKAQEAESKAQEAESKAQEAESKAQEAESKAQEAESKAQEAESKAQEAENISMHWQQQAYQWHERILALHASTSWKITKPLRAVKRLLNGDFTAMWQSVIAVKLRTMQIIKRALSFSIKCIFKFPTLRDMLNSAFKRIPWLHQRLRHVALKQGLLVSYSGGMPGYSAQTLLAALRKKQASSGSRSEKGFTASLNGVIGAELIGLLSGEPGQLDIEEILRRIRTELDQDSGKGQFV